MAEKRIVVQINTLIRKLVVNNNTADCGAVAETVRQSVKDALLELCSDFVNAYPDPKPDISVYLGEYTSGKSLKLELNPPSCSQKNSL